MNMIDLLRPVEGSDRYEAVRVRAEVDTGSSGSVDLEDVVLDPTNLLRVRVRTRDDLDRSWRVRVYGEYYKVTGFRRLPPRACGWSWSWRRRSLWTKRSALPLTASPSRWAARGL